MNHKYFYVELTMNREPGEINKELESLSGFGGLCEVLLISHYQQLLSHIPKVLIIAWFLHYSIKMCTTAPVPLLLLSINFCVFPYVSKLRFLPHQCCEG